MARGHAYRDGRDGRSFRSRPGVGAATLVAALTCSRCGADGTVNYSTLPPPEQIDQKFSQRGWNPIKRLCPNCIVKLKESAMASKPSPSAMKAQGKMFELLSTHFDEDAGAYADGWSDAKVVEETGIGLEMVVEFRRACFGELKEPSEVRSLRDDINALEKIASENNASISSEIAGLRGRLAKISARWAA